MRLPLLLALLTAPTIAWAAPPTPAFSPRNFFTGRTEGRGTLNKIMSRASEVTVHGQGRPEGNVLVLDQTVIGAEEQPTRRQWRLVETSPGHFRGTLSDADGPVTGTVVGNDFHVSYRTKGAVAVDQHLFLQPGGRVILNQMEFRKFGIRVARLTETIRKID